MTLRLRGAQLMYNVGNQPTLNNTILFYINHLEQPETENPITTNIITNFSRVYTGDKPYKWETYHPGGSQT